MNDELSVATPVRTKESFLRERGLFFTWMRCVCRWNEADSFDNRRRIRTLLLEEDSIQGDFYWSASGHDGVRDWDLHVYWSSINNDLISYLRGE
jgi:hypothetical protein